MWTIFCFVYSSLEKLMNETEKYKARVLELWSMFSPSCGVETTNVECFIAQPRPRAEDSKTK